MLKLQGKTALITGGGRGIGQAMALRFAQEGATVIVVARTTSEIEKVVSEIKQTGSTAHALTCDISNSKSVEAMFVAARKLTGDPNILVNNAGIAESSTVANTSDELWQRHLDINLSGTFYCTRAALPSMLKNQWGRIINIASIAAKTGALYTAAYSASKHGVLGLTRCLALEVGASGITVNAICPGYVETEMVSRGIERITKKTGRSAEETLNVLKNMSPQKRLVTAEEVASLSLLLASEEGRGINGQGINIDGGTVLN